MIKGVYGKPYIDMEPYLDMEGFQKLVPEIIRGFAIGREYAKEGTWMKPGFNTASMSYNLSWKTVGAAIDEFLALPDTDPIKMAGIDLYTDFKNFRSRNKFTRYVKMAMGAYDPYIYYFLSEDGDWNDRAGSRKPTEESVYFPGLVKWVQQLIDDKIFASIGRVILFVVEADGIPFEHRDLGDQNGIWEDGEYSGATNEFIHIRPNTRKPFYVWDPDTETKIHLNTRAAWFHDEDWHGGDKIMQQSWSLRIDGKFTEAFHLKLKDAK